MNDEVVAACPECGHDVPATVTADGSRAVPDTEAVREAEAWFREDPERVEYAPMTVWGRHAMTIVRAALARDDDRELRFLRMHADTLQNIVERAFAALPDGLDPGDDSLAAHIEAALARENENERLARMAMQMRDRMHDDDPIGDRDRAELAEDLERIRAALARDVPAPEPQADEPPFAVGDRVRVKSTGRTGVLREIDSRGRHLIFGDDESWITGVRADNLEPAPEPRGYRKGFDDGVKYARDIDRTIARMTVPAAPVDEAHRYAEGYDPHETGSLLVDIRAAWLAGHRAARAAAGAERVEEER